LQTHQAGDCFVDDWFEKLIRDGRRDVAVGGTGTLIILVDEDLLFEEATGDNGNN
jgi:hypothetical protein